MGAKVISIGVKPNGLNINDKCGSTFPKKIQLAVKKHKANLGISLDGDADRINYVRRKRKNYKWRSNYCNALAKDGKIKEL